MNTSRIPKPGTGIPSRMPQPTSTFQKRAAVGSDVTDGPVAKRAKEEPSVSTSSRPASTLMRSQSMLHLAKPSTKPSTGVTTSRVLQTRRPLATSNNIQPSSTTSALGRKPAVTRGPANNKLNAGTNVIESRMHAMEARLAELENAKISSQGQITVLDTNNVKLERELKERELLAASLQEQLDQLKLKLKTEIAEKEACEAKAQNLEHQLGVVKRQKESLEGEISANLTEIRGLKNTVAELTAAEQGVKSRLEQTTDRLEKSERRNEELENVKATLEAQVALLNARLMEEETLRRKLHNTVQELKGNIRVFCRIRPLLSFDKGSALSHFKIQNQATVEIMKPAGDSINETLKSKNDKLEFSFDRVFGPESGQADVFSEISQLVQSALDGYNVCVFAYGQTGSGKTHTMEGGTAEGSEGMIPRAVQLIFQRFEELKEKGWEYKVEASFLEIYNEQIRDLLGNNKDIQHEIRAGEKSNEMIVTNLKIVDVTNATEVYRLLSQAQQQRAVAITNCNERSSRSHSVFRLKITGKNNNTSESCQGTLHLVDLAGSERLKESGATGARLTETKSINKSLANLSNVIMALASKNDHIPYRNSKLTHLLQCSLGGNSKTLMFVNVSPKDSCVNETINSLRFATKVSSCHIGTATKRIVADK